MSGRELTSIVGGIAGLAVCTVENLPAQGSPVLVSGYVNNPARLRSAVYPTCAFTQCQVTTSQ